MQEEVMSALHSSDIHAPTARHSLTYPTCIDSKQNPYFMMPTSKNNSFPSFWSPHGAPHFLWVPLQWHVMTAFAGIEAVSL